MEVVRDGAVESVHSGHVAVVANGVVVGLGRTDLRCYARSALKLVQAAAVLEVLGAAGRTVEPELLAIAAASHDGTPVHTEHVRRLLDRAGARPADLRCPPGWPLDPAAAARVERPAALTHNCSGKHAAFLWGQRALGGPTARYLDADSRIQRRVAATLTAVMGLPGGPGAPGVDGCGAPTWQLPIDGLARVFAAATCSGQPGVGGPLAEVADAMRAHPELVGGSTRSDTRLMRADRRVLAKRGAEGVLGAAITGAGVVVKIADGGGRAAGPVVAHVLEALGAAVPGDVRTPVVLGGGRPHGELRVTHAVREFVARGLAARPSRGRDC